LAWLEARLAEAPERPTLVFMHHPPFRSGLQGMDAHGLENADGRAAVIARHPCVERIVCGHLHRAITRRIAGTTVTASPGTAHQVGLDLEHPRITLLMEPAACALHLWLGPEGGLVTHLSYPGRYPSAEVFDGQAWRRPARPLVGQG